MKDVDRLSQHARLFADVFAQTAVEAGETRHEALQMLVTMAVGLLAHDAQVPTTAVMASLYHMLETVERWVEDTGDRAKH